MARTIHLILGLFFVALGVVGAFLPVLPTVPFLLLAIFFFARSRPEWAERLYAHPRHGAALRQWRDRRAIGRKAKLSSVAVMTGSGVVSLFTVAWPWALGVIGILLCSATWIWTRPE